MEVPRATMASQEKEIGPVGGLRETAFPPGMTACDNINEWQ